MTDIRIADAFQNGKAFIPFVTCGDPDLETTGKIVRQMVKNGADLIELGIPFSDPTAEGPVIQGANIRALAGGVTTDKIFGFVKELREDVKIPLVFMTYANVVFSYGAEKFISTCAEIGIDGLIDNGSLHFGTGADESGNAHVCNLLLELQSALFRGGFLQRDACGSGKMTLAKLFHIAEIMVEKCHSKLLLGGIKLHYSIKRGFCKGQIAEISRDALTGAGLYGTMNGIRARCGPSAPL